MPRPIFTPTAEQRALVKSMAGLGTPHEDIARKIGIRSPKTLRKHFRDELDLGSTEAIYNVARTAYQMAISGDYPAMTIFFLKTRARWRERPAFEPASVPLPPFVVARESEGSQP
jgi:hypothetical protein